MNTDKAREGVRSLLQDAAFEALKANRHLAEAREMAIAHGLTAAEVVGEIEAIHELMVSGTPPLTFTTEAQHGAGRGRKSRQA